MSGKRLILAMVVVAGIATFGSSAGAAAQSPAEPGVNYAGDPEERGWLRLAPSRDSIVILDLGWGAPAHRCSNRKGYSSWLFTGSAFGEPIEITPEGTFRTTVVDRYADRGSRYHERQIVAGTITDESAFGTIRGRVKIVRPSGLVVRCTFGPQNWRLVN